MENKNIIDELFGPHLIKSITKEIFDTRRCVGEDDFSYDELEKTVKDKTYILKPSHVPLKESTERARSNCKDCYGTGRTVMNISKSRIQNPNDFVVLSDVPTKDLSDEDLKKLIEKDKEKKFWRVLLPCRCTIIDMIKNGEFILSNDMKNIVIRVECTEKAGE